MLSVRGSSPYDHNPNHNHSSPTAAFEQQARAGRKRKAESQDNERLSKRLSCLNLATGQNLRNLYATVEDDSPRNRPTTSAQPAPAGSTEHMQLDDSKHKVYIYNIDDELTSSDSEPDDGRVVFLPDIERALRMNRIPPIVKANSEGQLAGQSLDDMQVVLYNVPSSLTVAPEHDSVRKAIIEARARARRGSKGQAALPSLPEPDATMGDQVATEGSAGGTQQEGVPEDADAMDLS